MATVRRIEQPADSLYKSKLIPGFCYLTAGQGASLRASLLTDLTPRSASCYKKKGARSIASLPLSPSTNLSPFLSIFCTCEYRSSKNLPASSPKSPPSLTSDPQPVLLRSTFHVACAGSRQCSSKTSLRAYLHSHDGRQPLFRPFYSQQDILTNLILCSYRPYRSWPTHHLVDWTSLFEANIDSG
jgi:hypothetical protein